MSELKQEWYRKQLRKILTEADGRAALKEFGIDVEIADPTKKDTKPNIVVLCATYRSPEPQMRDALTAMVRYTHEQGLANVYSGPPLQSSVVHWSRNALLTEHLKSGKPWDYALLIDDDMVVEPNYLELMLSHKADIVGGIATRRQDPPVPNIRFFEEDTGNFRQIWEWPKDKAAFEVGAVGTGLMLVSRHAFEQVAQAYFDCLYEKEFYRVSDDWIEKQRAKRLELFDKDKICYWFRFQQGFGTPIEYGEDMWICMVAKRYCGIPTIADARVLPGHIGNYAYSIRDFEPYRDQCVLKAKVMGQYPMEILDMKISILCPTRGRPENVQRLLDSIAKTSRIQPEVVFYVDEDDQSFPAALPYPDTKVIVGPRMTLSKCFNRCASSATGEILMLAGDDIVFKTEKWDDQVRRAFAAFEDRLIFVHGDDGVYGTKFGTHGFVHRAWMDAAGYFVPPYFSSDYNDTWLNEVFNAVDRRIPLDFVTEHLHPLAGKAEWDQTHQERLARHQRDNVAQLYADLAPERAADIEKLKARLGKPYGEGVSTRQPELAAF